MRISFGNQETRFRFWRPKMGRVFDWVFAFDAETTLINDDYPWITPTYVIGAAFDGDEGYFVPHEHLNAFFQVHAGVSVAMHNAAFDLAVINVAATDIGIYDWVDDNLVWDTMLLHQLYTLATAGHTAAGKGQSTLERCVERHLGRSLPKDTLDSRGKPVRLSYGRWLGKDPRTIKRVYLEYLGRDVVATYRLFRRLRKRLKERVRQSDDVWGYVPGDWLEEQIRRWGPSTHHIQLRASIVLREITANGLTLDRARREELASQLKVVADEHREVLHRHGYVPGQKGSGTALQTILRKMQFKYRDIAFRRTPTGAFATSADALAPLAELDPFVYSFLAYQQVSKLLSSFLDKMARSVLHPKFHTIMVSGRTSSSGDLNAQNLPRDHRVRECIVPSPGHVFIDADYATIEMAVLAQACMSQFGLDSKLAGAINDGQDVHVMVAALATGKREKEIGKDDRQKAKPINFGKPGAMGNDTLRNYARTSYGVALSEQDVQHLSDAWFRLFPEMAEFLRTDNDLCSEIAKLFDLTPMTYKEHTGSDRFLFHASTGREHHPLPALGGMLLKVLGQSNPATGTGRPYSVAEIDFFWTRVVEKIDKLPTRHHTAVRQRRPSAELKKAVMGLVGRAPMFTMTGRLRAAATFAARHNNVFQGVAADGAKLALWKVWRAGHRIVNFVHDELLVEIPEGFDLGRHARKLRKLMISAMREVVPDVRIEVDYVASTAWSKRAERLDDSDGRLVPWSPPKAIGPTRIRGRKKHEAPRVERDKPKSQRRKRSQRRIADSR